MRMDTVTKTLLDKSADEKANSQTLAFQPENPGGSDSGSYGVAGSLDSA